MKKIISFVVNWWRRALSYWVRREEISKAAAPAPRKPSRPKRRRNAIPETLAELLEHISIFFEQLKFPDAKHSWLPKDDRKGLRKIGIHVANPWLFRYVDEEPLIDVSKPLPAILCIGIPRPRDIQKQDEKNDLVYESIMFAIKMRRLPSGVTPHRGQPYMWGYAAQVDGEMVWLYALLTINEKTGRIYFCDEQRAIDVRIPIKNNADRSRFGGARVISVRNWQKSVLLIDKFTRSSEGVLVAESEKESIHWAKLMLMNGFAWWGSREQRWSVSISFDDNRITFPVERENTKHYFADRDKSVKTPSGATKKIVHYVVTHDRRLASGKTVTIKEHIRGLREFDWNGYHCLVTAPKFTSELVTSSFPLPAEDLDPGLKIPDGMMTLKEAAQQLVEIEESDKRKISRVPQSESL